MGTISSANMNFDGITKSKRLLHCWWDIGKRNRPAVARIPDVALVWDWPDEVKRNGGVLGMAREKDILIHNRSDQYVYNVQVESVKLHQELSFDLINEIAPGSNTGHLGGGTGNQV